MINLLTSTCRNVYFSLQIAFWIFSFNFHTYFITEEHFTGNQSVVINRQTCLMIT